MWVSQSWHSRLLAALLAAFLAVTPTVATAVHAPTHNATPPHATAPVRFHLS